MLTVNDSIKQAYNQYTTQRKSYIQVGNNSFFIQNLDVSADAYYEGNVIGNAIAKIAKFDIETVNVNGIDEFELFDGIWTGNQYEYISLGTFKLFNEEGTDDFFSSITAYDKLINFNKEYDPSLTTYPTTIYGLLQNICSQAGVELENSSIPNGNQPLPSNLFVENETLKMILNAICQISGNFGIISKDKLKLLLKGTETVNLSKYQLSNPEYKRTTWKINQIVLGMKDVEGEYVLRQDVQDIEQNGVHKLVINDNPFVYRQDLREAYIDNLFNQVKGFGYIAFETTWEGLSYVELGDLLNVDGKESIVLRYNLKSPHGLNSTLSAPSIIDSVIDYVDNSNSIANRQRRTELWVNKELGEIKSEVIDVETTVENITTTTQTSTGKNNLHITDSLESNALEYHIEGKSEQETSVQGNNILGLPEGYSHTSGSLTVSVEDGIIIINGSTTGIVTFDIPIPKLKLSGDYVYSISGEGDNKNNISLTLYDVDKKAIGTYIVPPADSSKRNRYALSAVDNTVEYIHFYAGANYTFDNVKLYYMINEGTALLPFEKFVPNSPSPDYPSKIKTIPSIRNLYNLGNQTVSNIGITSIINGSEIKLSGTSTASNYIFPTTTISLGKFKAGTYSYHTNSDINNGNLVIVLYNITNSSALYQSGMNTGRFTFTLTEETELGARIWNANAGNVINGTVKVQIEEGSIIHDYVPYGAWLKTKIINKNLLNIRKLSKKVTQYTPDTFEILDDDWIHYVNTRGVTENVFFKEIEVEPNTNYYIYFKRRNSIGGSPTSYFIQQDESYKNIKANYPSNSMIIKTENNTKYVSVGITSPNQNTICDYEVQYMIVKSDVIDEEYKVHEEKEVLIDLSKPNLWDKDNANKLEAYLNGNTGLLTKDSNTYLTYISCNPNSTYTIEKKVSSRFVIYTSSNKPAIGESAVNVASSSGSVIHCKTNDTANYLIIMYYKLNEDTLTEQEILDSIKIYEGYTDYYELSSIGDIKDELSIIDGQVVIDKKIGKVVLNGSESWNKVNSAFQTTVETTPNKGAVYLDAYSNYFKHTYYATGITTQMQDGTFGWNSGKVLTIRNDNCSTATDFKIWLSENNTTVYYELAESKQICLPNVNIPLFEGINHITLVDDLETTTSIKYYRNTPISQDYVIQQQLDETNSNLSTTTDKTNQNASDINATNTNLNNNYYSKDQIDVMNTSTQEIVTQIKNQVETTTTATNLQISILQEQLTNGVTAVRTETGYTFDKDGLKIQKSGSEMSSQLDNDGLVVKRNETEVLTVRSSGVETENLTVRTHFIIGDNTRVENYKGGTGFFYIGGAN